MNIILIITFCFLYFLLILKSSRIYPILYLFLFIYFIQYIHSTYLIYYEYKELKYQMTINADRYFTYAIPAIIALFSGVMLFNKDIDIRGALNKIKPNHASYLGLFLLISSYSFDFLYWFGLSWLGSIVSFTSYLKYLSAFCFLYSKSRLNYIFIILVYAQLALSVLRGGVFISFFIWTTYLFFFIALKFQLSFYVRMSFILIAVPILIAVQTVKEDYREKISSGKREGGVELFTELAEQESNSNKEEPFSKSQGVIRTVGRLTQGWHLGLVLKQVPKREPFSYGEELLNDVTSSILPRIFFPDKKTVNSQDKFYKYTGHKLFGNTSMSIGVLGDFYINFGVIGSFIALFLLGAFISKSLHYFIVKFVLPDPLNIIWIPYILTYLIRGNNDFYIFFNGMVKGFILFLIINYIRHRFLNHKTDPEVLIKPMQS